MSRNIQYLDPEVIPLAQQLLAAVENQLHVHLIISFTTRTDIEQADLYAEGRWVLSTVGCMHPNERIRREPGTCDVHPYGAPVTNAMPGKSWHNFPPGRGRAFDVTAIKNNQIQNLPDSMWIKIGAIGEALGLSWGGRFHNVDLDHFQYDRGQTLEEARVEALTKTDIRDA